MKNLNHTDLIAIELWKKQKKEFDAKEIDFEWFFNMIRGNSLENINKSGSLLSPWLNIYENALHLLYLLKEHLENHLQDTKDKDAIRSLFLMASKAFDDGLAVRILAIAGFDNGTRYVLRSMLESLDLMIIFIGDKALAEEYSAEDIENSDNFWFKHLSRNRREKRVIKIINSLQEISENFHGVDARPELLQQLSESLHCDVTSGFRAAATPSLEHPGMLSMAGFGTLSYYTPQLLQVAYERILANIYVVFGMTLNSLAETEIFIREKAVPFQTLIARFNSVAELMDIYADEYDRITKHIGYFADEEDVNPEQITPENDVGIKAQES